MSNCRLFFLIAVSATILCQSCTHGGPARSLALAAARASKIPRSIRAPFRNTEMMTARGFGKRSQLSKFKEGEIPWPLGKRETKFFDEMGGVDSDVLDQIFNDQTVESFPIEWLANEMQSNPILAQQILRRFVDTNRDGVLSAHELLSIPQASVLGGSSQSAASTSNNGQSSADSNDIYLK